MKNLHIILLFLFLSLIQINAEEWIALFNGKDMSGWQASENKGTWKVENGELVTSGPRSHLFYTGNVLNHDFKNFEITLDVKTKPGSNSGIYFHTQYQEKGWPEKGYECQIINSNNPTRPVASRERKMTGSLYAIRNVWKSPVPDNEWFRYHIVVQGKTIKIYINWNLMTEYTEPINPYRTQDKLGRILSSGTFALQGHDKESEVHFKNIRVNPLPDDLPTPGTPPDDLEFEKILIDLAGKNLPLMDLHVHLKEGLTMEDALFNARKYGFSYGIAVNCGLKMGLETETALNEYLDNYKKSPNTWLAMQAEGREWMDLFSEESVKRFDYVFTDAMTWTNDNGKRMRLWLPDETEVGDPQNFMDQLVNRLVGILENEPIQIYVNPTFLPDEINSEYDVLWTNERMDKVIKALAENHIALEINNRRKIPSPEFIKRAKLAGVKFTFGTNNKSAQDLGRMDYAITMIKECGLTFENMWIPGE